MYQQYPATMQTQPGTQPWHWPANAIMLVWGHSLVLYGKKSHLPGAVLMHKSALSAVNMLRVWRMPVCSFHVLCKRGCSTGCILTLPLLPLLTAYLLLTAHPGCNKLCGS